MSYPEEELEYQQPVIVIPRIMLPTHGLIVSFFKYPKEERKTIDFKIIRAERYQKSKNVYDLMLYVNFCDDFGKSYETWAPWWWIPLLMGSSDYTMFVYNRESIGFNHLDEWIPFNLDIAWNNEPFSDKELKLSPQFKVQNLTARNLSINPHLPPHFSFLNKIRNPFEYNGPFVFTFRIYPSYQDYKNFPNSFQRYIFPEESRNQNTGDDNLPFLNLDPEFIARLCEQQENEFNTLETTETLVSQIGGYIEPTDDDQIQCGKKRKYEMEEIQWEEVTVSQNNTSWDLI